MSVIQKALESAPSLTPFDMASLAANLADDKKAVDTRILETAQVSYLADYFVICSGESKAQTRSLTDEIEHAFRKLGFSPIGQERDKDYRWCLLDYGDVVIHVMNKSERQFYQLEHFWNHANEVDPKRWLKDNRQVS